MERVDGGPRRRNIAFWDYRNKGLRECPEDFWRQRNQEICTQLTRYSAGGRGWRLQKAVKETYFLSKKNKHRARLTFSKTNRRRECLSHTRRDYAKNQRIASLRSKQKTGYWNILYRLSRTTNSWKDTFRRNGYWIDSSRKQAKEKTSINKSKTWKNISGYRR